MTFMVVDNVNKCYTLNLYFNFLDICQLSFSLLWLDVYFIGLTGWTLKRAPYWVVGLCIIALAGSFNGMQPSKFELFSCVVNFRTWPRHQLLWPYHAVYKYNLMMRVDMIWYDMIWSSAIMLALFTFPLKDGTKTFSTSLPIRVNNKMFNLRHQLTLDICFFFCNENPLSLICSKILLGLLVRIYFYFVLEGVTILDRSQVERREEEKKYVYIDWYKVYIGNDNNSLITIQLTFIIVLVYIINKYVCKSYKLLFHRSLFHRYFRIFHKHVQQLTINNSLFHG